MLMRDPYAGHRSWLSGESDGRASDWTSWDFALATAVQWIEDGTTEHGTLRWEQDSDDVDVEATRRIDKAQASIDRITQNEKYKALPGEYYTVSLIHPYRGFDDPEPKWQTRAEWIVKQINADKPIE